MEIVQKENKVLRQTAKEVPVKEIASAKIRKLIADMKKALASQEDGVAIAAPQIGASLRIFVISGKVFSTAEGKKEAKPADMVFINPEITKLSKKKETVPEGCLSVRWLYGEVKRSTNATIRAYDEKGKAFIRGGGGLLAQIFQHETDHLNGILFTDKAKNLVDMPPEKNAKK
jgi:peptide deformylase